MLFLLGRKERFYLHERQVSWIISRLLKQKIGTTILRSAVSKLQRHSSRKEIETALFSWINAQLMTSRMIYREKIKNQAAHFQVDMNMRLLSTKETHLKFSNGWLQKFKKPHALRSIRLHGSRVMRMIMWRRVQCPLFERNPIAISMKKVSTKMSSDIFIAWIPIVQ